MKETLTPAMRQYYEVKQAYPDTLIFFRMGDFYESFGEDAKTIAKELEITLTARGKDRSGKRMPLAGIPYHAVDTYLPRLINKGYKVAICEQLEDPKQAKGVVKRGVVRVVTPGTAIDSSMFSDASNNYLMAVAGREIGKSSRNAEKEIELGVSFLDISTGEFLTTQFRDSENFEKLLSELARMRPSECILPPSLYGNSDLTDRLKAQTIVQEFVPQVSEIEEAEERLKAHFKVETLEGMGCEKLGFAIYSAWAALEYAQTTQMRELTHINTLRTYSNSEFMILDSVTLRNLEIVKNVRDEGDANSLYRILDCTKTPMGSRTLKKWLLKPLLSVEKINLRLDAVEELAANPLLRYDLRSWLSEVRDIERLVGRIVYGNSNARDLVALKKSLGVLPPIRDSLMETVKSELLNEIAVELASFSELENLAETIG
jgi:DNA mismatch repair protein MutS